MVYQEYAPDASLRQFVECYWSAKADHPPFQQQESLIPDGTIELMFNFGDPYFQLFNGQKELVKGSHLIGIRKQSLWISQQSHQDFFCVRFKLGGAYPFLRVPTNQLHSSITSIHAFLGTDFSELEEELYELQANEKRVARMNAFLLQKLQDGLSPKQELVNEAIVLMAKDENASIQSTCRQVQSNYKTLERHFKTVVGLNPRELRAIRRFNRAVHLMYSCQFNTLTAVAYAAGYFDQSHFIREFKRLADMSPKQFLRKQFTIVQVIQPALAKRMSKSYNFSIETN